MKVKFLHIFTAAAIMLGSTTILSPVVSALPVFNVTIAPVPSYSPGATVTVSGTSNYPEAVIKVLTPSSAVLYVDAVTTNSANHYTTSFILPSNAPLGQYKIVAGWDSDVSTATFQVQPPVPVVTGVNAVAGKGQATVSFTLPTGDGSNSITGYKVVAQPGGHSQIGTASPITVTGLTNGIPYTFTVTSLNNQFESQPSAPSSSVIPGSAELLSLALSAGPSSPEVVLTPAFDKSVLTYQATVAPQVSNIAVNTAVYYPGTTMSIQGTAAVSPASVPVQLKPGSNTIEIMVTAADGITTQKYTIQVQRRIESESAAAPAPAPSANSGFAVIVNGQTQEELATAATTSEGHMTATIDSSKFQSHLSKLGDKPTVVIPVPTKTEKVSTVLNGESVKTLENKQGTLRIETADAAYDIPAGLIAIDQVSEKLGTKTSLSDIAVNVVIASSSAAKTTQLTEAGQKQGFTLAGKTIDFSITANFNGNQVEVDKFDGFVKREVTLPDGSSPSQVTTAVVLNADGTVRHVPTAVMERNGKYYASINSLTNSTYSLIWKQKTFTDVMDHWARQAVENMSSRLIVNGVSDDQFLPNASITRAEFTAILVRGLGLAEDKKTDRFKDVSSNDWFNGAVQKGVEYNLIQGYEDGTFGAGKPITREEALVLISRAVNIVQKEQAPANPEALAAFEDHSLVSQWAVQDTSRMVSSGLVQGRGATLEPKSHITRAETAALVQRVLSKLKLINE
jgi:hypothetical protein